MELIQWDNSLSIHVQFIDDQHKRLISMINELGYVLTEGKVTRALPVILQGLLDYTVYHFDTEEEYFEEYGYEHAEEHLKEHRGFIDNMHELIDELNTGNQIDPRELLAYLQKWLVNHIQVSDKEVFKIISS